MKRRIAKVIWPVLILIFGIASSAVHAVPSTMNYSGYLTDNNGSPVSGSVKAEIHLYDLETGGQILWKETHEIAVTNGALYLNLGSLSPIRASLFSKNLFLQISINDEVLRPRKPFSSVPYALVCDNVVGTVDVSQIEVNGVTVVDELGQWTGSMTTITNEINRVISDLGLVGSQITLTGDVTGTGTGSITTTISPNTITSSHIVNGSIASIDIGAGAVTLGTQTTGNYVATVVAGTNMSVSGSGTPGAAPTVSTVANPTFSSSVTTPALSSSSALSVTGTGILTLAAATSGPSDKISFKVDGSEQCSINRFGALACTGSVSASNLSGNNTGDQTISLTGDVTGSGTGSFATTIANDAVALGTKTTGNYVATVSAGTNMSVSGSGSETAAVTVATLPNPTFSTSVTTPALSSSSALVVTGTGTLTLAASTSGPSDKISFKVDGSEQCSISSLGVLSCVGSIIGSNLSGTNTGDQTITLTGDLTGSGTGSFATTIANDAVVLGTKTTGAYVANLASGTNISVSGGGGETATVTVATLPNPTFATSVTTPAVSSSSALTVTGTGALTLAAASSGVSDHISFTVDGNEMCTIDNAGNMTVTGNITAANLSGTNTGDQTISLTGDVTGSGTGSFSTTIANDAVALGTKTTGAYVANLASGTNISVSGGGGETATVTVATLSNPTFSTSVTTPAVSSSSALTVTGTGTLTLAAGSSGLTDHISFKVDGNEMCTIDNAGNMTVTGNIAAANLAGTNTGDQTITLTGDVTGSGTGTFATTIANDAVALGTKTTGNYVATVSAGTNMSVSGSGSETAAVSVATLPNPTFSTSVTTPILTNVSGGGTLTINATTSGGSDKMSFTFGTAGSGSEVASLDESGNLTASGYIYATGNMKSTGGCFGRTYVASSANSTGGAGSRAAADALCNTASSTSKVCTYQEMIESARCGVTMPVAQGWINSGAQADCNAWTSGLIANFGGSWNTSSYVTSTVCSTNQPFLCCK